VTILLGFATTEFAMLGTDTRASQRGAARATFVDDDTSKVFKTDVRSIAGAAEVALAHGVRCPEQESEKCSGKVTVPILETGFS